jgi:hypothetical protein
MLLLMKEAISFLTRPQSTTSATSRVAWRGREGGKEGRGKTRFHNYPSLPPSFLTLSVTRRPSINELSTFKRFSMAAI